MLCSCCQAVFQGDFPPLVDDVKSTDPSDRYDRKRYCSRPLHDDISELCNGAINGCQICAIIWRHFFSDKSPTEYARNPVFQRDGMMHLYTGSGTHYHMNMPDEKSREACSPDALEMEIGLNSPMDRSIPEYKTIMLIPTQDEPAVDLNSLPHPDASIYGPNTWSTIQKWMSDCKANHKRCNPAPRNTPWYPTRLLDIQYEPLEDPVENLVSLIQLMTFETFPAHVRLIETATTPVSGPYMTLSHRWPTSGFYTTTERSNIKQRKRRIFAQELPANFEQAIHFARAMGVRYLWIDSLCIIQNDKEDWEREAAAMGDVYSNSFLNLSGTAAASTLIQPRDPRLLQPSIIDSKWKGRRPQKYVVTDFYFWDRVQKSPVNQRAWITQERWLSPRILHFTYDQLVWECRELEAAETFPDGLPKESKRYRHVGFKAHTTEVSEKETHPTSEHELYHADWVKVLGIYGRSEITKEKDRLVAVAGVAAKFSDLLDDEWVAGLWKRTLPGDLLWEVWNGRRSNKPRETELFPTMVRPQMYRKTPNSARLESYQAPSWSWACVFGDINPGFYVEQGSEESMVTVISTSVIPVNPGRPLGQIRSAAIKLHGTLYPIGMDPSDWPGPEGLSWRTFPPRFYITGLGKKMSKPSWEDGPTYEVHANVVHIHPDEPTEYVDIAKSCFLPLTKHARGEVSDDLRMLLPDKSKVYGMYMVRGLCLIPTGQRRGEYRRLGRVDFMGDETDLFLDNERLRRGDGDLTGLKAHEPSLEFSLYCEGEIGVFTII